MAQYLLPCECGRKLKISTSDAGERIPCECGRTVEVPTLRGMQSLELAAPTGPAPARRISGKRQGLIFLGASLIVLATLGAIALVFLKPPTEVEMLKAIKDATRIDIDKLTPAQAWMHWNTVREGLWRRPTNLEFEAVQYVHYHRENWRYWTYIAGGAAGLGTVLVLIGLIIPQRTQKRRVAKPPAPA